MSRPASQYSYPAFKVLDAIDEMGIANHRNVKDHLGWEGNHAFLAGVIAALVEVGYIEQVEDGREKLLSLTDKGAEFVIIPF